MKIQYRLKTDVLIVGMGGAGIRAAISASNKGAQVLMVGKCRFGTSGATFYPGTPGWGMQAVIHEGDSEAYFLEEILEAGAGTADPALSEILASQATMRFHELEAMGLQFERHEDGRYKGVIPCFGKRLRGSTVLGMDKIRKTMWLQLQKRDIRRMEDTAIIALIKKGNAVIGAVGLDGQDVPFFVAAKAVILATGGGCGIYEYSLATSDETGDGYVLALDAGAKLVNMEFIQFIPGLVWPVKKLLFQEKNLDTFPRFTNRDGEDILTKYLPPSISVENCLTQRAKHGPFTTADISFYVDLAMYEEAMAEKTCQSGGIHVSYDEKVLHDSRWTITSWLDWMHSRKVHPVEEGFDLIPHAQCFNGGIQIGTDGQTTVSGLFAAGETAGGAHGADRLGGAAIAATQVFGALAGEGAAEFAKHTEEQIISEEEISGQLQEKFGDTTGELLDIPEAMAAIRSIMWHCGAIVRNEARCREGLSQIRQIEACFSLAVHDAHGKDIRQANELYSYIQLAQLLLTVMAERKESRGPHYRSDYPQRDSEYDGLLQGWKENGVFRTTLRKVSK